ncbi:MFS transporter [Antrihabitans cavernicola]|nr:MFS transporter [Spelaeibacter cavernicola]
MTTQLQLSSNAPTATRSSTRAWAVSTMLVFLALVNWADKAILGLVAVPMMKDLGIGPGEYGTLAGAVYFLFAASAVAAGFLANRVPVKWLLIGMVTIWSLSQFAIWLAPTFVLIFLCRIVLGLGEGPSAGLSFHAAAKWFRNEERNLPVALQNVGSFGGIAVAAPGLTYIVNHWGWHWAFFAVGMAGLVWLAAWAFIGKDGPYGGQTKGDPDVVAADSVFDGSIRIPYRKILGCRSFIGCVCVGLSAYWSLAILSAWMPAYLRNAQGYSATGAANVVMAISLTAIAFLILEAVATNYLMKRGVSSRVARGMMASTSTAIAGVFVALVTLTTPGAAQIFVLCIGFGLGLVAFTTGAVSISEFVPALQRGAVLGIYVAILTSPGVYAPMIFGWIVSAAGAGDRGYTIALLISGALVCVGGIAGLVLIDPRRDALKMMTFAEQV